MSRRPDLSDMREVLSDRKNYVQTGLVVKPDHEASHYVLEAADVKVWVSLMPSETLKLCRLGSLCSGRATVPLDDGNVEQGMGIWNIPAVGTEVQVTIPHGELLADPVITATLSTGLVPGEMLAINEINDQIILIKHRNVTIKAVGINGGIAIQTLGSNVEIVAQSSGVHGGEVTIDGAQITLNGGSANVARVGDTVTIDAAALQAILDTRYTVTAPPVPLAVNPTGTVTTGNSTVKA